MPIIRHPDVRRMLLLMKSQTEAMRALAYVVAAAMDLAAALPGRGRRAAAQAFVELMIPVVKGWCTETGIEVASLGVQVHGGMGFIEETGAAQHLRDARITTIYEGTTGIQANDLVGRKIARDGGATARRCSPSWQQLDSRAASVGASGRPGAAKRRLPPACGGRGVRRLHRRDRGKDPTASLAGAVPFLKLMGIVAGGWQLARAALAAEQKLAGERRRPGVPRSQDRDRTLLRRPRARAGAGAPHHGHRRHRAR